MAEYILGHHTDMSDIDTTITQLQHNAVMTLINLIDNSPNDIIWVPIAQSQFDTTFGTGKLMYLRGIGFVVCVDGYLYSVEFGDGTCVHQPDMRLKVRPMQVS